MANRKQGNQDIGRFDVDKLKDKNPLSIFKNWYQEACKEVDICYSDAAALGTATLDGKPSVRTVIVRNVDENGFLFYTDYLSRKGKELADNPRACLNFYWYSLRHQVRVEGLVHRLSESENEEHFGRQSRFYQISCHANERTPGVSCVEELEKRRLELEEYYCDKTCVDRPKSWGGYVLVPEIYEFWEGQKNMFNDRFLFRRLDPEESVKEQIAKPAGNGWWYERLHS